MSDDKPTTLAEAVWEDFGEVICRDDADELAAHLRDFFADHFAKPETVEAVARAVGVENNADPDDASIPPYTPAWMDYRSDARAALAAVLETLA